METLKKRTGYQWSSEIDNLLSKAADQGMDEEEQEKLIARLSQQDQSTTSFYRNIFISLPATGLFYFFLLLCVIPYPAGVKISSSPAFYVLAILSFLVSLVTAYAIPVPATTMSSVRGISNDKQGLQRIVDMFPVLSQHEPQIRKGLDYLVPLNALLCVVICLVVANHKPDEKHNATSIGFLAFMVLFVSIIVSVAKYQLRPVDIPSLERLKYNYRGA